MTLLRIVALFAGCLGLLGTAWGLTLFSATQIQTLWLTLQRDAGPILENVSRPTMATMSLLLVTLPSLILAAAGHLLWSWTEQKQEYEDERWRHFHDETPTYRLAKQNDCRARGRVFKSAARVIAALAGFSLVYFSFSLALLLNGFKPPFGVQSTSKSELLLAAFLLLNVVGFVPLGMAFGLWRLGKIELKRAEEVFGPSPSNDPK